MIQQARLWAHCAVGATVSIRPVAEVSSKIILPRDNTMRRIGAIFAVFIVNALVVFLLNQFIFNLSATIEIMIIMGMTVLFGAVFWKKGVDRSENPGEVRKVFTVLILMVLADFAIAFISRVGRGIDEVFKSPWLCLDWFIFLFLLNSWVYRLVAAPTSKEDA